MQHHQNTKPDPKSKHMPGTAHRTDDDLEGEDGVEQDFLVFEQTSDNGQGMRVHQSKSKIKMQKRDSMVNEAVKMSSKPPLVIPQAQSKSDLRKDSAAMEDEVRPTPDQSEPKRPSQTPEAAGTDQD